MILLANGLAATVVRYRAANPFCKRSIPCPTWSTSLAIGPTVSRCFGSTGKTPFKETSPKVVFKPTMPQQAAGTRTEPAVSVPKATSTGPSAAATAEPLDDPPGINPHHLLKGFFGVP